MTAHDDAEENRRVATPLYVYSFMVVPPEQGLPYSGPCPSCTSIIDAVDGAVPHLTQLISFAD